MYNLRLLVQIQPQFKNYITKYTALTWQNLWIIEKLRFRNLHHSKYDNYAVKQKMLLINNRLKQMSYQ